MLQARQYQLTGIDYMVTPRVKQNINTDLFPTLCRSLNSDAPGAGKTKQATDASNQIMNDKGHKNKHDIMPATLILTPAHLTHQWYNHTASEFPNDSIVLLEGTIPQKQKDSSYSARWYITSIQSLRYKASYDLLVDLIVHKNIQVIILDESHYVKNKDAKQSKNIYNLMHPRLTPHCILLTATPIMREADDLYHQLHIIDPYTFHSHDAFLNTYCWFTMTAWGAQNVSLRKGAYKELQALKIEANCYDNQSGWILGRTYEEIGLELPRLIEPPIITSELTTQRRKAYDDIKWTWSHQTEDGEITLTQNSAMEVMHLLRRLINSPEKAESLVPFLNDDTGPFFILTEYKWSQADLANEIRKAYPQFNVTIINGTIPSTERIELARNNSTKPNDIVIATLGSVPEGADLSSCNTVYFYEEATTPGKMYQVLSRVRRHRNSDPLSSSNNLSSVTITEDNKLVFELDPNSKPILCRYFHAENTLDKRIHDVQKLRAFNARDIVKVELSS